MATTRAKFRVTQKTEFAGATNRQYKLMAVMDNSTPENARFSRYTPSGEMTINVDNPDVELEVGADYYLDFTKADQ